MRAADPDRKLKLGLIGCGWYGMVDVKAAFKVGGVEVDRACATWTASTLARAPRRSRNCRANARRRSSSTRTCCKVPGLEAVIIATPPHWHALQLIAALERGPGCLLREAAQLRYPRRPRDGGRGEEERPHRADRFSAAAEPGVPGRAPAYPGGQRRPDRLRRGEHPLHRRHQGRHAAAATRFARLGPLVRPRARRFPTARRSAT